MKVEKILIIPDTHCPYHDKKAWRILEKSADKIKPDHVIILGDFADFYSVSSHSKNPERAFKLEEEISETIKLLKVVKSFGAKNNIFIAGNHEDRLTRYLQDKAPELFPLTGIPSVLKLKELGYKYIPYKREYKLGKVNFTHDLGKAGVSAHRQAVTEFRESAVIGHTHRMSYEITGTAGGKSHVGAMFGWLGNFEEVDYMHNAVSKAHWSHGFGLGYFTPKNGFIYLTPVPIIKYTCIVEGKLISL